MDSLTNIAGCDGDEPLKIYFLDNSSKTLMVDDDSTAKDVCDMIAHRLNYYDGGIRSSTFFAIFESDDGAMPKRALAPEELVRSVQHGTAKLIYMMKLCMPTALHMVSYDEAMLHMQYIQGLHRILTGVQFHGDAEKCIQMGALSFYVKYGYHNHNIHKLGFITHRLLEFIPANLMSQKAATEWEEELYEAHAQLRKGLNAKLDFVKTCHKDPNNGCHYVEVKQKCYRKHPSAVLVGININGVWVLDKKSRQCLEFYHLSEAFRWGFKPGLNFYFEVRPPDSDQGMIYEFGTTRGNELSALMTDYADALLDELGYKDIASAKSAVGVIHNLKEVVTTSQLKKSIKSWTTQEEKELFSIVYIQKLWRGYKQRCHFENWIGEMEEEVHGNLDAYKEAEEGVEYDSDEVPDHEDYQYYNGNEGQQYYEHQEGAEHYNYS